MKLLNSKDIEAPWVHVFLYGESGSGKTQAASTFPRPLFVQPSNEGSMATLAGQDFPYVEVKDLRDMTDVVNTLEADYTRSPDKFPYDTIVFESLTHYIDLVIEDLTSGGTRPMDQQKWGTIASHLRNIGVRMRNMEVNVVYIALSESDDAGGGPVIPGKSAIKIPAACDVVGYCQAGTAKAGSQTKEPTYKVYFRRYGGFFARSRFKGVPPEVENFRFDKHIKPYLSK